MRKLYNEFFKISEDRKICDKVMIARVVLTVSIMVMCLTAMSMTAYAYFSHNIVTSNNIIKSAEFSMELEIKDGSTPVKLETVNSKTFKANFVEGKTYTVTVIRKGDASTGFCTVYAENCINGIYHTQQLGENGTSAKKDTITFTLSTSKDTVVTFTAHWGTSSKYTQFGTQGANGILYIEDKETVAMTISDPISLKDPNPNKGEASEGIVNEESVDESDDVSNDVSAEESNEESNDVGAEESTEESKDTVNENGEIIYIVKAGDMLSRIAAMYDLDYRDLAYYNGIENPSLIEVDQIIKIPPSDWVRPKDDAVTSTDESIVDESSSAESENNQ